MNNEQIKQAMESWYQEGYQAAAQSRDKLIGKLVKALATCRINKSRLDNDSGYTFDGDDVKQALADAKAQGYGE